MPVARAQHHAVVAKLDRPLVAVGCQMANIQNGPGGQQFVTLDSALETSPIGRELCIPLISYAFREKLCSRSSASRAFGQGLHVVRQRARASRAANYVELSPK